MAEQETLQKHQKDKQTKHKPKQNQNKPCKNCQKQLSQNSEWQSKFIAAKWILDQRKGNLNMVGVFIL